LVAPPIDRTVATTVFSATEFLYIGADPIQTGVAPGTIDAERAAVLRGLVTDVDSQPLGGVTISVHGHPEYGQTLSRADGWFDLVVNGGGLMRVVYGREGYLPVQRQLDVAWESWNAAPVVVMTALSPLVTTIYADSSTLQTHIGELELDEDGSRQQLLLFRPGTLATLHLSDGSTQELSSLDVRVTEYTVGATGPDAMPAELPPGVAYTYAFEVNADEALAVGATTVSFNQPGVAYTYAFEVNADEALAVGATTVSFNQPVVEYHEDFMGLPAGAVVPVGTYDQGRGLWVPEYDGVVLELVDVLGGFATIDTDGDGLADDAATLEVFGITDDERALLGARYAPGQRLWRAALEHFSIYDYNFRIEIPTDDAFPPERIVSDEAPVDICPGSGSIIKKQPQSLEEAVDLGPSGTGLHYSCERTKGRRDAFSRTIHVTGPTFSPSMRSPRVRAVVAGQVLEASFSVAPNVDFDLEWDGKDAYGRTPQGPQRATVEVIYRYPTKVAWGAEYGSLVRSFGRWTPFYGLLSARPVWNLDVGTKREIELGTWDESVQKLGGWSLDDHHSLSMATGTVFFGDGRKQNDASSVANLLARRVAAPTTSPSPRTGACSSAPLATTACERSIPPSCSTKSSATAASTMLTKTAPLPTSAASTWMTRAASMSPKTTRFGEPLPMETWRWWRRAPTVSSVTIPVQPWTRG